LTDTISVSCEIKTKPKPKTNKMRLIVDSGSTKADWIAINEEGKVLFTTQTLGLNPEILENSEVIERLNDRFDILQNKTMLRTCFFTALVVVLIR
jgi:N-acetylglucosamine kinase-like BadF-type ATPase